MASLIHLPGMQLCIIMPEKERHLTFSLFLHFPILCRVATFASVFVVPFSVILTSHLLHVLEDSYHNYSTEEAVLNFSYNSTPWTAVLFPTESDESVSSPVHF